MEALVLAAGKGTRMRGLCDATPKPMLPMANRPVLEVILGHLAAAGSERAFVVVGHLADQVRRHFQASPPPIPVEFILQERATGTGSAALLGRGRMKEQPFFLAFGDIVVSGVNYAGIVKAAVASPAGAILATRRVDDPCRGAAVYVDAQGWVTRIIEKPPKGSSTTHFDNAGLFCFPPRVWDLLEGVQPSPRGEYELTDAIAGLMAEGGRIRAYEISGYWLNLTGPEELLQASAYRLAETAAGHPGTPGVRPPIVVDPSARIGRCVLGPCVAIGPRCRVEDGAHVEHAILMADAVVERNAVVRHAVIAEDGRAPAGARIEGWPDQAVVVRRGQTA